MTHPVALGCDVCGTCTRILLPRLLPFVTRSVEHLFVENTYREAPFTTADRSPDRPKVRGGCSLKVCPHRPKEEGVVRTTAVLSNSSSHSGSRDAHKACRFYDSVLSRCGTAEDRILDTKLSLQWDTANGRNAWRAQRPNSDLELENLQARMHRERGQENSTNTPPSLAVHAPCSCTGDRSWTILESTRTPVFNSNAYNGLTLFRGCRALR